MKLSVEAVPAEAELNFPMLVQWGPNQPAYLVIDQAGQGILIRPTKRGMKTLNSFWKVWLRNLLMQMDAYDDLQIWFEKRGVRVKSPRPLEEWITEVRQLAANVVPIKNLPVRRVRVGDEPGLSVKWIVDPGVNLEQIVREIELPACDAEFWELWGGIETIRLQRSGKSGRGMRKRTFETGEIIHMIELQIAVACRRREPPRVTQQPRRRIVSAGLMNDGPLRRYQATWIYPAE